MNYYNEIDSEKAQWIRELMKAGVIADGEVDERDIREVQAEDLKGFTQCHFFAGIAVWFYALRLAGWPDGREVWTGSCPCPSFSTAGKGQGFDDARHLWPDWFRLIRECKPATVFGEQADDAIGFGWLDLVQSSLEAENYAVGKAVLASASVGGADLRERLYFVADSIGNGAQRAGRKEFIADAGCKVSNLADACESGRGEGLNGIHGRQSDDERRGSTSSMADSQHAERRPEHQEHSDAYGRDGFGRSGATGGLGDTDGTGLEEWVRSAELQEESLPSERPSSTNGFWANAEWI